MSSVQSNEVVCLPQEPQIHNEAQDLLLLQDYVHRLTNTLRTLEDTHAVLQQTELLAGVINEQDCRDIRTACCCLRSLRIRLEARANVTEREVISLQLQLMHYHATFKDTKWQTTHNRIQHTTQRCNFQWVLCFGESKAAHSEKYQDFSCLQARNVVNYKHWNYATQTRAQLRVCNRPRLWTQLVSGVTVLCIALNSISFSASASRNIFF